MWRGARMTDEKHIAALTGLRGVLSTWVVALHIAICLMFAGFPIDRTSYLIDLVLSGDFAVDGFFMLSGFILSYVYTKRLNPRSIASVRKFLILRVARIYPVHAAILFAYLVLIACGVTFLEQRCPSSTGGFVPCDRFATIAFLRHVTMTASWGWRPNPTWNPVAWSISSEWFAYLAFPLILLGVRHVGSELQALCGTILSIVGMLVLLSLRHEITDQGLARDFGLVRLCGGFLAGCFAYRYSLTQRYQRINWSVWGSVATVLFLLSGPVLPGISRFFLFVPILLALAQPRGILSTFLGTAPFVWLGKVSYSLYLVHLLVLELIGVIFVSDVTSGQTALGAKDALGMVALASVSSLGLASAFFYGIEEPARKVIKRRWG